jgi:hypothetical protein
LIGGFFMLRRNDVTSSNFELRTSSRVARVTSN